MKFNNLKTKKTPIALHFNGINKDSLTDDMLEKILEYNKIEKPDNLTILTFATDNIIDDCILIKQLEKNNIEFFNLCDYYKWDNWNNTYKIKYMQLFLKENFIKTKYVIVLDAFDVLLSEDFINIVEEFKKTNKKIFYGSTVNRHPDIYLETFDIIRNKGIFMFLNAGTVIAETSFYKNFIDECFNNLDEAYNKWNSEQLEIRKTYCSYDKQIVGYDHECNLFQTFGKFGYFKIFVENNNVFLI